MSPEYYNNQRHHKPKNHKRISYKPRALRGNSIFLKVVIVLVLAGVVVFGLLLLLPKITGGRIDIFAKTEPTPEPTPEPTQTAHPMENADMDDVVHRISITDTAFQWFSGGCVYDDTLMFCAGEIVGGDAYMTALMEVSVNPNASSTAQRVNIVLENDHIMSPVFNGSYLCYLDAKASGGGKIFCAKYGSDYSDKVLVKEVYTGYPTLLLSDNFLAWTERTGTSMDKLYLCDLETMETATVQMFNKTTYYGVSKPHMKNGKLVWADVDTENANGGITSQISVLDIKTGEFLSYKPGTYVHDPKTNGKNALCWLTGNHGSDSDLYVSFDMDEPVLIAENVVDFYMDDNFAAYQKDGDVYVYILSTQTSYRLNRKGQEVQLLSASGGCVMWVDVTSRERENPEFAIIPD